MKKTLIVLMTLLLSAAAYQANARMTDDQVVKYVKQATEQGKTQNEISRELLARGVTVDQVNRLKEKYENGELTGDGQGPAAGPATDGNARQARKATSDRKPGGVASVGQEDEEEIPAEGEQGMRMPMPERGGMSAIFGHDIFRTRQDGISFEPNENVATPENYKLGPGDEVIVDIWGYNEAKLKETITPEGNISIEMVGPVYLTGLSVKEAEAKITKVLAAKYAGVGGEHPQSEVSVSLGAIRTIQVNVMGDVEYPGAYRLSSFSTLFSALYAAGGVSETGSLRDIQVYRNGKKAAEADIYAYIFDGKSTGDIRLQDADVIVVPAYVNVVSVSGGVKRPMRYEMAEGETVADLLRYCGGFTGKAFDENVSVLRYKGDSREILTAAKASAYDVALRDGDEITVGVHENYFANRLEVKGFVINPGTYEYGETISTVKQLVAAAGGLKEDAFLNRAVLQRIKEDRTNEMLSVDLGAVMKGTRPDVALRPGDVLTVAGLHEMNDRGQLAINGMVVNPGFYDFAENTTLEDLIVLAGGLRDGASLAKVDVSRRIADPYGLEVTDTIGQSFSFAIKDGLVVDGAEQFYLKPYDVVFVRKSPAVRFQQYVQVEGEVAFPGRYMLQTNGERLSSVIRQAGGVTYLAYVRGGQLKRSMTEEEIQTARKAAETERQNILRQKQKQALADGKEVGLGETDLELLKIDTVYTVAVDFEKALANPGGSYDIILREGDIINIPDNIGTVAVKGSVLAPNTVTYVPNQPLRYYVRQAGGYNNAARKSKVYVVYMNGSIGQGASARIEPGCTVIVPSKPEHKGMTATEAVSIGTSTASLATMVVSLINLLK